MEMTVQYVIDQGTDGHVFGDGDTEAAIALIRVVGIFSQAQGALVIGCESGGIPGTECTAGQVGYNLAAKPRQSTIPPRVSTGRDRPEQTKKRRIASFERQ